MAKEFQISSEAILTKFLLKGLCLWDPFFGTDGKKQQQQINNIGLFYVVLLK